MAAIFWVTPTEADSFDTNAGQPGAAPNGAQMPGNPDTYQVTMVSVNTPNVPQNSAAQGLSTQLSAGNIPHNLQPTNVNQGSGPAAGTPANAGGDSLMAMMSRGQVIRNDSTYGQGGYTPSNGTFAPAQPSVVAQPTGPSSGVTYANNGNYSGM
jgi:hypothetical protein